MGTLYIVSTPIGNLDDISIRALKTLFTVDYIACEDTRRTGLLLHELRQKFSHSGSVYPELRRNIASHIGQEKDNPTLIRYDDRTEQSSTPQILDYIKQGKSVALVSDAGTPLISDPGYILVRESRKLGVPVVSIPGASAVLAALTSSGLPTDKFMYLGYPAEKQSHRVKLFQSLNQYAQSSKQMATLIFYCAPHKLHMTLVDMNDVFGNITIVICRELTKVHEEYWKGSIKDAMLRFREPKGELVVLFALT